MSKGRESSEDADAWTGQTRDLFRDPRPTRSDEPPPETTRRTEWQADRTLSAEGPGADADEALDLELKTRLSSPGGLLKPGQVLFDKYLVVRRLGQGGMGEVWLVRHLDLDAERALKLIISNVAFDAEHRARFRREARVMARFTHPNAVTVHDAVVRPDGNTAYIEMEYVRGRSLKELLEPGVPMPLDWTARIVAQLCDALQVAHENGIVHRDLKPSNLMLLDGQPPGREHLKVLDFGIAKILGADQNDPEALVSRADVPLGTPLYMSPEQIVASPNSLDARSDIYSVGMILYELLTGHQAFAGAFHKLIYQHMHTPATPLTARNPTTPIPPEVERVVLRCLEKDPSLRPQSARALAEEFLQAAAPVIQPLPVNETGRTRPWRTAVWAALAAAAARSGRQRFGVVVSAPVLYPQRTASRARDERWRHEDHLPGLPAQSLGPAREDLHRAPARRHHRHRTRQHQLSRRSVSGRGRPQPIPIRHVPDPDLSCGCGRTRRRRQPSA